MTLCRGSAALALYLSDMGTQPDVSGSTARRDPVAAVRTLPFGRAAMRAVASWRCGSMSESGGRP
jgi:hypothetical protein